MNSLKTFIQKTLALLDSDRESRAAGERIVREITLVR